MEREGWEGVGSLGKFLTTSGVTPFPTAALVSMGNLPQNLGIMMIDIFTED